VARTARTLETTLEAKLAAVRVAENNLAAQRARRPVALTEQELAWITTAGRGRADGVRGPHHHAAGT
jgi:hypothetical protein